MRCERFKVVSSDSLPCATSLTLAGYLPLIAVRVPPRLQTIHVALRIEQPQRSR